MDEYLQRAKQVMLTAAQGMTVEQLAWHPAWKWSAAEIMEHLSRAFSGTAKGMARVLEAGAPPHKRATLGQRLSTLLVIHCGYFPSGRQAPEYTVPKGIPPAEAEAEFQTTLAAADEAITQCERRFGSHTRIANHPIFGPLTAHEWRKFHWLHTRHHAKQVEALRAQAREGIHAAAESGSSS